MFVFRAVFANGTKSTLAFLICVCRCGCNLMGQVGLGMVQWRGNCWQQLPSTITRSGNCCGNNYPNNYPLWTHLLMVLPLIAFIQAQIYLMMHSDLSDSQQTYFLQCQKILSLRKISKLGHAQLKKLSIFYLQQDLLTTSCINGTKTSRTFTLTWMETSPSNPSWSTLKWVSIELTSRWEFQTSLYLCSERLLSVSYTHLTLPTKA